VVESTGVSIIRRKHGLKFDLSCVCYILDIKKTELPRIWLLSRTHRKVWLVK